MLLGIDHLGRHPIAHPFAAAIVLLPQYLHPGVLQHIQQAILMTGPVLVILAPGHVGEHARHGNRRGGAAGAYMAERHQTRLLVGEGVGVLLIAVQGVVLAARRLPHHQEHQGRFAVAFGRDHGVASQRQEGHGRGEEAGFHILEDAGHIVGGHYLLGHGVIVAAHRGVILIIEGTHGEDEQGGEPHAPQPQAQPLVPARGIFNLEQQQAEGWQHPRQHEPSQDGAIEIRARLPDIGLHHVLHHVLIEDDPVFEHGVTGQGANEDQHTEEGLEQVSNAKRQEHQIERRQQQQRNGEHEADLDVIEAREGVIEVQEDRPVEYQSKQQHQ